MTRRTKAEMESLREALYAIVEEDRPMTCRQVFYRAVVAGLVEKTESAYDKTICRQLLKMRRAGDLPYD